MQLDVGVREGSVGLLAAGETLLQRIVAPTRPDVAVLHHRIVDGDAGYDGDTLVLAAGARVSFNCYFSCFYASYWATYTTVADASVAVVATGAASVELYCERDDSGTTLVATASTAPGPGRQRVVIPLATAEPGLPVGRWFVEVIADGDCRIEEIGFATSAAPAASVVMSAGVCTYRGDHAVVPVLRELVAAVHDGLLTGIVVVNHGARFEDPGLRALVSGEASVRVVEQPNLGAAGGFARTMVESAREGRATHHLVVEDDAEIDHRVLATVVSFLAYARSDMVVGAPMADLRRVTSLHHTVVHVRPDDPVVFTHPNLPLDQRHALNCFNDVLHADYTGWWCTAIPHSAIDAVGLPAPLFVQHDDLDYGLRLQEHRVPTVLLPGVAAWHEPFDAKPISWKAYYDLRNRLIVGAVHPRRVGTERWTELARRLLEVVAQHDYQRAAWMLQAVDDYLAGPDAVVARDPADVHTRVMQCSAPSAPASVDPVDARRLPWGVVRPAPATPAGAAVLLAARIAAVLVAPGRDPDRAVRFHERDRQVQNIGRRPWILANDFAGRYERYTPSRRAVAEQLVLIARAVASYRSRGAAVARAWRAAWPRVTAPAAWEQHFDAAPEV